MLRRIFSRIFTLGLFCQLLAVGHFCLAQSTRQKPLKEKLDDDISSAIDEIDRPVRPPPSRVKSAVKASAVTVRGPAAVAPNTAPAMTFDQYVLENAGHPGLTSVINDQQAAFVDTSKPALISLSSDSNSTPAPEGDPALAGIAQPLTAGAPATAIGTGTTTTTAPAPVVNSQTLPGATLNPLPGGGGGATLEPQGPVR